MTYDIPNDFIYPSISSHVLLAACKEDQVAYEAGFSEEHLPCGAFTNVLMESLYQVPLDRITYSSLIDSLRGKLRNQDPQCGGAQIDGVLFAAHIPPAKPSFTLKKMEDGIYQVEVGEIHGVSCQTEFTSLSAGDTFPSACKDVFVANKVLAHSSTIVPVNDSFTFSPGTRVVISNWQDQLSLRLFIKDGSIPKPQLPCLKFVANHDVADLEIRHESRSGVVIERKDTIAGNRLLQLPATKLSNLPYILESIALFRYHLLRHHGNTVVKDINTALGSQLDGAEMVEMHLYRLGFGPEGTRVPIGDNLFSNHQAELPLKGSQDQEKPRYGIKIINQTRFDLFPYLFYFDPSDYSIAVRPGYSP